MSNQARNVRVGIFVFAGMLAIGSCSVILGGQNLFATTVAFETVFDESVQGLEIGSAVKLRGVKIGTVTEIGTVDDFYVLENEALADQYQGHIVVRMEAAAQDLPLATRAARRRVERLTRRIEQGLRLRLTQSGITGVAYIGADILDPERNPPMEIAWEPAALYVPSTPSTIAAITSAAERIVARMETMNIEKVVGNFDALLLSLTEVSDQVGQAGVPAIGRKARRTLDEASATLARIRATVEGGQYDVGVTLENLRVMSEDLRDLSDTLKSQPSLLLRGEPPERRPVEAAP